MSFESMQHYLGFSPSPLEFQHLLVAVAGAFAIFGFIRSFSNRKTGAYPPGPRGWPLIGNIFDIPAEYPWKVYRQWGREARKFCVAHSLST